MFFTSEDVEGELLLCEECRPWFLAEHFPQHTDTDPPFQWIGNTTIAATTINDSYCLTDYLDSMVYFIDRPTKCSISQDAFFNYSFSPVTFKG